MSKAKSIVRTSQEYIALMDSKERTSRERSDLQFYIRELEYSERQPVGAARTRGINKNSKSLEILLGFQPDPNKIKEAEEKAFMKTVVMLCEHMGENAPTKRTARRLWVNGQDEALLSEMVWRCIAFDNDGHIEVPRWERREVEIPVWMTPEEFIASYGINLQWYLGFGGKPEWPEEWYRKITALRENARYAVIKLLNQKSFRVEKRQAMRNRFEAWLNGTGELGRYDWSDVGNEYTDREASCISNSLYWDR